MAGIIGILQPTNKGLNKKIFTQVSDQLPTETHQKNFDFDNGYIAVSWLPRMPLKGHLFRENDELLICFYGDMIGVKTLPWNELVEIIETENFSRLENFNGIFSIIAYDKLKRELIIISDRRSQQPIYYKEAPDYFVFSSELSTFTKLADSPAFNERWFYDFLFFNFAIDETTFLKNVYRMPPSGILHYSLDESKIVIASYSNIFRKKQNLLYGTNAFRHAKNTFVERVPKYYEGVDQIACALTNGWDGRTMLALSPKIEEIATYTYGVPGCSDLIGASKTAKFAELKHIKILLDQNFEKKLPEYIQKTVFFSSGLQNINRSTLLYVYESLTQNGAIFPLIISGIALDELFRGQHSSPNPIPFDVVKLFQTGKGDVRKSYWSFILGDSFSDFYESISQKLEYLEDNIGSLKSTEAHLLYKIYMLGPQYFSGELKIANNFTTVRVPAWDSFIIDLAFSVKESALSFSSFSHSEKSGQELCKLQAYIISNVSPMFSKIPLLNTRPDIVLKPKIIYNLYMLYRILYKQIRNPGKKSPPLENWDYWFITLHKDFFENLIFSDNSLIRHLLSKYFIDQVKNNRDSYWISKLATTELILRYIRNKWSTWKVI